MRVLVLTNLPTPYKVDFFNELGKAVELTVIFERKFALNRNKSWLSNEAINFKSKFLSGLKIGLEASLSISVIKYALVSEYDYYVLNGYSSPTSILLMLILKVKKIPFMLMLDGAIQRKNSNCLKEKIKRFLINLPSFYLSPSEETDKFLVSYSVNNNKIFRFPFTSVKSADLFEKPLTNQEKVSYKKRKNIKTEYMLITVAQFIHRKGIDVLLKSAPSITKEVTICIVGGSPNEEYKSLIRAMHSHNILFFDFMDKQELTEMYRAADVFVLPTREDVWGLVVNEAMAHGLPVIATDKCIAAMELIDEGKSGFIISSDDPDSIAEKVNCLVENLEIRENMTRNALDKIQKYTIEEMAQVCANILKNLK